MLFLCLTLIVVPLVFLHYYRKHKQQQKSLFLEQHPKVQSKEKYWEGGDGIFVRGRADPPPEFNDIAKFANLDNDSMHTSDVYRAGSMNTDINMNHDWQGEPDSIIEMKKQVHVHERAVSSTPALFC